MHAEACSAGVERRRVGPGCAGTSHKTVARVDPGSILSARRLAPEQDDAELKLAIKRCCLQTDEGKNQNRGAVVPFSKPEFLVLKLRLETTAR